MKKLIRILTTALPILVASASTFAHHSSAPHFDNSIDIEVKGVITEWKFVNPHSYLYFDVTAEDGSVSNWRCEGHAAAPLRSSGFTSESFVPGQEITIQGHPARREDNHCLIITFVYADGTEVPRNGPLPADKIVGQAETVAAAASEERPLTLENGQPNISGFWVRAPRVRGAGGGAMGAMGDGAAMAPRGGMGGAPQIALTDAGSAQLESYEQIYDDPSIQCDIANIFFGWTHDANVNQITQEDDKITLLYGYMDFVRTIHLDRNEHPDNITPSRGGHSIGKWEDGVLVVDTVGFTPGVLHPLAGIPHSDKMHTVERFSFNPENNTLNRSYVANDPTYHIDPYTGQDSLIMSQEAYTPYDCTELSGDNNRRPEERS